ncbi:MAG: hypothetical protein OXC14_18420 [Rhodospirillaceae bacterium]|nr:hypothetical protein [Rhodospirillaceae bacterium]
MAEIERSFNGMTDRYEWDFTRCLPGNGWAQVDTTQDASYFGTWANPFERKIVNYCEGDITETTASDDDEFITELMKTVDWNRDAGYWKGIDGMCSERIIARFTELGLSDLLH